MITEKDLGSLFDSNSFVELGEARGSSVITGYGTVSGKLCYAFLQDSEIDGGAFSKTAGAKICAIYRLALKAKAPVVGLLDSTGFLVDEGGEALNAFNEVYSLAGKAADEILQIMIIGGKCIGQMQSLSETADILFKDMETEEALMYSREMLRVLPPAAGMLPEQFDTADDLNRINFGIEEKVSDGREILREISDDGFLIETNRKTAPELTCGFIKVNGIMVAAMANNTVDGDSRLSYRGLLKAAKLVRIADKFSLGILNISNTEGFSTNEDTDLMARGAQELSKAFTMAAVPKINLITGKVVGGIYSVMNGRYTSSDLTFAWRDAEVCIIDPKQAADLVYGPLEPLDVEQKTKEYEETHTTAEVLAALGLVDKIIDPEETRKYLAGALETYANVF
ncbi:MAG: hypothetical protein IKS99_07325 [Firmicutes bacterium]|nr:hypothetical protein [Bacillota bacterium]